MLPERTTSPELLTIQVGALGQNSDTLWRTGRLLMEAAIEAARSSYFGVAFPRAESNMRRATPTW